MIRNYYQLLIAVSAIGLILAASGCNPSISASPSQTSRKDSLLPPIVFMPEEMGDFNQVIPSNLNVSFNYKDPNYLYIVNGDILSEKKKKKFLNKRHGHKIESFQTVPAAVAVPVYGGKAANGAVLITTK